MLLESAEDKSIDQSEVDNAIWDKHTNTCSAC